MHHASLVVGDNEKSPIASCCYHRLIPILPAIVLIAVIDLICGDFMLACGEARNENAVME